MNLGHKCEFLHYSLRDLPWSNQSGLKNILNWPMASFQRWWCVPAIELNFLNVYTSLNSSFHILLSEVAYCYWITGDHFRHHYHAFRNMALGWMYSYIFLKYVLFTNFCIIGIFAKNLLVLNYKWKVTVFTSLRDLLKYPLQFSQCKKKVLYTAYTVNLLSLCHGH